MKNTVLLLIIFFFSISQSIAQIDKPREVNAEMSEGVQRGWKFLVPEADEKTTLKAWEKLMKDYDAKTDNVKKSDDYLSENVILPAIQERPIMVYAQFDETPEGVYVTCFFDLGGAYLNSDAHKEKAEALSDFLENFARDVATEIIDEKIKDQEKAVEKLEKEEKDLKDNQKDYEDEIAECEEKIRNRKNDLQQNKEAQDAKARELEEQRSKLEEIKKKKKKL